MNNPNHPKKGSSIKVEPIRNSKDVKAIKSLLSSNPRDFCLFTLGINTNLKTSDLLKITAGHVRNLKTGDAIMLTLDKKNKVRKITLNNACVAAIQTLLKSKNYLDNEPLFVGQRGVLRIPSINRLVKQWCQTIKLKGNYGCHTMRKTFGYQQRVNYGVAIPLLMETFNHSTQKEILNYLCIQDEEVRSIYDNEI